MNTIQITGAIIAFFTAIFAISGCAMAAQPVPETIGTAGITSTTSIECIGTVTQSDSLTWIQSNDPNGAPPLESATVDTGGTMASTGTGLTLSGNTGQIRYTSGYTSNLQVVQGTTILTKSVSLNNANQIADHNNIETNTLLTFVASNEAGQAVGSEDILLDGTGATATSADKSWSPFGISATGLNPPFAATVNSGSSFNILLGTIDTQATQRFIAESADVPVSQTYSITGRGITSSSGTTPAGGTMSAFMNVHIQEGIIEDSATAGAYDIGLGSDIQYASAVSASGYISSFNQAYGYNS
jgi:hypothetical protein